MCCSDSCLCFPRQLLTRFYALLHSHNPELAGDKKKFTLVPPQVNREGTKKTVFANIADICRRMRRQPKHLMEFLFAELGTSGSVDGSQRLMIKGRYTQKNMENVLKKYIGKSSVLKPLRDYTAANGVYTSRIRNVQDV
jgi:translation initiation factor 2 subunit 2